MRFWEDDGPSKARGISLAIEHPTNDVTLFTVTQRPLHRQTSFFWSFAFFASAFLSAIHMPGVLKWISLCIFVCASWWCASNTRKRSSTLLLVPGIGIQLSTRSSLIPLSRISGVHLNEVVHGWKVIWVLVIVLQNEGEEGELMVAFEDLKPPLKILVQVWKQVNSVLNSENKGTTRGLL